MSDLRPKELDVVRLRDGREATVLEAYEDDDTFLVEESAEPYAESDIFEIHQSEISKIIYHYEK